MNAATLEAEALERRTAERRAAHGQALVAFYGDRWADRRTAERRASDSAMVSAWVARFHALREGRA